MVIRRIHELLYQSNDVSGVKHPMMIFSLLIDPPNNYKLSLINYGYLS